MVAAHHAKMAAGVREFALLDVLDPRAENADWDVVLLLASYRAGVTANTTVVIDYKAIAQRVASLSAT
jgi:hypothetical protein